MEVLQHFQVLQQLVVAAVELPVLTLLIIQVILVVQVVVQPVMVEAVVAAQEIHLQLLQLKEQMEEQR